MVGLKSGWAFLPRILCQKTSVSYRTHGEATKTRRKKTGASLPDDQSWHNFVHLKCLECLFMTSLQLISWEPPLGGFSAVAGDGELKTKMVNGGSIFKKETVAASACWPFDCLGGHSEGPASSRFLETCATNTPVFSPGSSGQGAS